MILRFLNWQGIVATAASLALGALLLLQKGETSHWKKQSTSFEQLYRSEQSAFATTVAGYRTAAAEARAADQANATRVAVEQAAINERTEHDFEARLAAARADAQRMRGTTETDPGARGRAPMPRLSAAPCGAAEASGQDGLSQADSLTATEQAIQLDELIRWVRAQAAVDNNPKADASPPGG